MPLRKGHQLGRVFVQHAWKVAGAFSIGVVAVVGAGLFLSDVHRIPQTARSSRGTNAVLSVAPEGKRDDSSGRNGGAIPSVFPDEIRAGNAGEGAAVREQSRRSRRRKSPGRASAEVADGETASAIAIAPGPNIATQLSPREPAQLASVLSAAVPTLPADSPIAIRLVEQVSTKENHKGDVFKATLAAPLVANGIVIAKAGAPVLGRIVDARSARLFRGGSTLNLELTDVQTDTGHHLRLKTKQWYETGSHSRFANAAIIPGEAAKKAVSGVVAGPKPDGEASDSSERTVAAGAAADPGEKTEKKRTSVVVPSGSEIVFHLLEPVAATGNPDGR